MGKHNIKDYSKAKVYALVNSVNGERYIGSTIKLLYQRKEAHIRVAKYEPLKASKLYQEMRKHGPGNFSIVLLYEYAECRNREQLRAEENKYILQCTPELNTRSAYTGKNQKEYYKDYAETHKTKLQAQARLYRSTHREAARAYEKQWKLLRKEQKKQYKFNKKETIKAYQQINIRCDACGKDIRRWGKSTHEKTATHCANVTRLQAENTIQGQPMDVVLLNE